MEWIIETELNRLSDNERLSLMFLACSPSIASGNSHIPISGEHVSLV